MKQKINMMSEIAEKYGLKLGEYFYIFSAEDKLSEIPNKRYKFTDGGIKDEFGGCGYGSVLQSILIENYFVEKVPEFAKPIKCNIGDQYQFVEFNGEINRTYIFDGATIDYLLRNSGNMFAMDDDIPQGQINQLVKEMKGE